MCVGCYGRYSFSHEPHELSEVGENFNVLLPKLATRYVWIKPRLSQNLTLVLQEFASSVGSSIKFILGSLEITDMLLCIHCKLTSSKGLVLCIYNSLW